MGNLGLHDTTAGCVLKLQALTTPVVVVLTVAVGRKEDLGLAPYKLFWTRLRANNNIADGSSFVRAKLEKWEGEKNSRANFRNSGWATVKMAWVKLSLAALLKPHGSTVHGSCQSRHSISWGFGT
ncbi:hypothetical protein CVT26_000587 [Gymnopilus dilepis]|uniref:Uncharacterized protein n=1 Tax=Gymnopilus dilepis TaxID=231916 RepID=A0A409X5P0_9AGAR|nr:hypothetical protein CVT26_000587 [Gymnopilus dilepis]